MKIDSKNLKIYINEVFFIEPNNLGFDFLNFWFKKTTFYLKRFPFLFIIPLSGVIVLLLYLLFGQYLVWLANLLQYGF